MTICQFQRFFTVSLPAPSTCLGYPSKRTVLYRGTWPTRPCSPWSCHTLPAAAMPRFLPPSPVPLPDSKGAFCPWKLHFLGPRSDIDTVHRNCTFRLFEIPTCRAPWSKKKVLLYLVLIFCTGQSLVPYTFSTGNLDPLFFKIKMQSCSTSCSTRGKNDDFYRAVLSYRPTACW
jgi:hypothetical protein